MFSLAALGAMFAVSLVGGFFLTPPGRIIEPAEIEPYRNAVLRIVPERRLGRLDVTPTLEVAAETGCAALAPGLRAGAQLFDAIARNDGLAAAISNRFANVPSPAAVFTAELRGGGEAELSLAEYKARPAAPKTVRIRLRDADGQTAARTVRRKMPRSGVRAGLAKVARQVNAEGLEALAAEWEGGGFAPPDPATPGDRAPGTRLLGAEVTLDGVRAEATLALEPVAWPFRPVPGHLFGIDSAGRDVLSRVVAGTRVAMVFGLVLAVSSMLLGILAGALQGYLGGAVDIACQRFIEIWSALPFLYVMMLAGSVLGRGFGILLVCYGLFNWIGVSYYMRAEFLRLRGRPFVEAARCQGYSGWSIVWRHILPNAMTPVVTLLPFSLIGAIASISALDFLGFGLPPLTPSLGELLRQAQENGAAWWLVLYPAAALFAIMLLAVFVGEGLRDAFDPKPEARYE